MKMIALMLVAVLLTGCGVHNGELNKAMEIRAQLLTAQGCSFDAVITANYSDKTYTFAVAYTADSQGNVTLEVLEPETIAGITGNISAEGCKLTFDDQALAFELLADGQVTPVSAGYLLVKTLRNGYVRGCGTDGEEVQLLIDDSYQEDALNLDIRLGRDDLPISAEILYKDRRFLSLEVKNFRLL